MEELRRLILSSIFNDYKIPKNFVWGGQKISGPLFNAINRQTSNPEVLDQEVLTWIYGPSKNPYAETSFWYEKILDMSDEELVSTNLLTDKELGPKLLQLLEFSHMSDGWFMGLTKLMGDPTEADDMGDFRNKRLGLKRLFDRLDTFCRCFIQDKKKDTPYIPGAVIVEYDSKKTFTHFDNLALLDMGKNPDTTMIFPYLPGEAIKRVYVDKQNPQLKEYLALNFDFPCETWDVLDSNQFAGNLLPEDCQKAGSDSWSKLFHKTPAERKERWVEAALEGLVILLYPFANGRCSSSLHSTIFEKELHQTQEILQRLNRAK